MLYLHSEYGTACTWFPGLWKALRDRVLLSSLHRCRRSCNGEGLVDKGCAHVEDIPTALRHLSIPYTICLLLFL